MGDSVLAGQNPTVAAAKSQLTPLPPGEFGFNAIYDVCKSTKDLKMNFSSLHRYHLSPAF